MTLTNRFSGLSKICWAQKISLHLVAYGSTYYSDFTFEHVKNGTSICALAHERYAPSFQSQSVSAFLSGPFYSAGDAVDSYLKDDALYEVQHETSRSGAGERKDCVT
jgi:hypothetical protein